MELGRKQGQYGELKGIQGAEKIAKVYKLKLKKNQK
jgi:hypothetical protein